MRVIVLPHNEEGVLDNVKAINEWIKEKERIKADKERRGKRK